MGERRHLHSEIPPVKDPFEPPVARPEQRSELTGSDLVVPQGDLIRVSERIAFGIVEEYGVGGLLQHRLDG